ncbi:hypothetical protein HDK77DRAFT_14939 [Phyllosticta capitalensis]
MVVLAFLLPWISSATHHHGMHGSSSSASLRKAKDVWHLCDPGLPTRRQGRTKPVSSTPHHGFQVHVVQLWLYEAEMQKYCEEGQALLGISRQTLDSVHCDLLRSLRRVEPQPWNLLRFLRTTRNLELSCTCVLKSSCPVLESRLTRDKRACTCPATHSSSPKKFVPHYRAVDEPVV